MELTADEVAAVFRLAEKLTGTRQQGHFRKDVLIANVQRRMSELQITSLADYIRFAKSRVDESSRLISALTIHTTSWFRESPHFEILKAHALKHERKAGRKFRVWSAACSTGEEVFSIGLLLEAIRLGASDFDYEIVGTDIDPLAVQQARSGIYRLPRVDVIPAELRAGLLVGSGPREGFIKIDPEIRSRCRFAVENLTDQDKVSGESFDVVFCRNVLIYFSPEKVEQVVAQRLFPRVKLGGLLILGHSEPINESQFQSSKLSLKSLERSCYERIGAVATPRPVTEVHSPLPKHRPKVLAVDDSPTIRASLRKILPATEFDLVESSSAEEADDELARCQFDLITLDLGLPGQNGSSWLQAKRGLGLTTPVVIISETAPEEAEKMFGSLGAAAQDYIVKRELRENPKRLLSLFSSLAQSQKTLARALPAPLPRSLPTKIDAILIGVSTGGPAILPQLLANWPTPSPPILLVQHIPPEFAPSFARRIGNLTGLKLEVVASEVPLKPDSIYMSGGDSHLQLLRKDGDLKVVITQSPKQNGHRPSVDALFNSAATAQANTLAVVLTGMGDDGANGLTELMTTTASYAIAQDEASSSIFGMPLRAIETGYVSTVANIDEIRQFLIKQIKSQSVSSTINDSRRRSV